MDSLSLTTATTSGHTWSKSLHKSLHVCQPIGDDSAEMRFASRLRQSCKLFMQ